MLEAKYSGLHSTRHFFASWLINRKEDGGFGVPLKVVQSRMGHDKINVSATKIIIYLYITIFIRSLKSRVSVVQIRLRAPYFFKEIQISYTTIHQDTYLFSLPE